MKKEETPRPEKFTKEQRHEIYKKVLKEYLCFLNNGFIGGLCTLFFDAGKSSILDFAEIMKHKPKETQCYSYWFYMEKEGIDKRIEILKQAIKETE